MLLTTVLQRDGRDWLVAEEARLVQDLEKGLGKQVLDIEMLANLLREKNKSGTDDIAGQIVETCARYPTALPTAMR